MNERFRRSTLRLTKRIVDRLKVEDKDAIFWDGDLAGFGVRVHATGRKLYIVQSRGPAGLKRVTLGPVGSETIDKRRREAAIVIDRIKRGEDPMPPKPVPEPTVADLAARCLKNHVAVRCKPNTAKNYRMALQNHILSALGKKALKDVVPGDVTALHHNLRETPSAANRAVWVLSRMFVLAENWEMMPPGRNPCRHVRYYREKSRERFLTPEEFRRLGAALKKFKAEGSMLPSAIAAVRLLMLTGCRSDEILSLKLDDVDRTARVLRLRDAKTGPRMAAAPSPARGRGDRLIDLRNRALLAVAYDAMLRRSELAVLQADDLLEDMHGDATLLVRWSKTDAEGCGEIVYLARDIVRLVRAWLARSGIAGGRMFRSISKGGRLGERLDPSQVPRIFKAMASRIETLAEEEIARELRAADGSVEGAADALDYAVRGAAGPGQDNVTFLLLSAGADPVDRVTA